MVALKVVGTTLALLAATALALGDPLGAAGLAALAGALWLFGDARPARRRACAACLGVGAALLAAHTFAGPRLVEVRWIPQLHRPAVGAPAA